MDQTFAVGLIAATAGLIGVIVTVAAAAYHITKQARMSLKVELYREIIDAIEKQSDAERELSTKLRIVNSLISVWLQPQQFGGFLPAPNTSWAELNGLYYRSQSEGADLMILLEKWQIVDPRLELFRLAFGAALHDIRIAWEPLSQSVGSVVPPIPGAPTPPMPPGEVLERVRTASESFLDAVAKLSSWAADFQVEMQVLLLSDLFPNSVTHRKPLDPDYFVVRLDRFEEQKRHFLNETAWGREMKEINERTSAEFASRGAALSASATASRPVP